MRADELTADLWPTPRLSAKAWWPVRVDTEIVERRFSGLYPGVEPVLFPSARAGLAALIAALGLARGDQVWLPRFSSHCVIDAIGRSATPQTSAADGLAAALVYHQWGYPHTFANATTRVIEDSADTLHRQGAALCAYGGEAEIVSLPKVLGCFAGGVVFCRHSATAQRLRDVRTGMPAGFRLQFLLKAAGRRNATAYAYWAGAECGNGRLPAVALRDIYLALEQLERLVAEQQKKAELLRPVAASWLRSAADRLPSNVPLEHDERMLQRLRDEGIALEVRHFNAAQSSDPTQWRKVIRVPIHADAPVARVRRIAQVASECLGS